MNRQRRISFGLWIALALAGCGDSASNDAAAPLSGSGGPLTPAGSGGSSTAGSGGARAGSSAPPAGGSVSAGGSGGTTSGSSGAGAGGAAGTMATAGAGGSGMPPGNTPFAIPATCGMPTPNATPGNPCPGAPPPAIKLTMIAGGFVGPTFAAQAPGDPTRIYVLEQQGTVRVVKDGMLSATEVIDLRDLSGSPVNSTEITSNYAEGGLLGMVFDPQFATTKKFWLSYTVNGPGFVVAEFTMTTPDTADVTSFKQLLMYPNYPFGLIGGANATNHVGSMLAFGPDGCMYVSRGEGGGENDTRNSGQNTDDDLASVLRIDVANYPTPAPGNLKGHVWNYGFRNPWRMSFDRVTGDLYIGDVGQDVGTGFEEINIEPRGVSGRNYGWSPAAGPNNIPAGSIKPAHSYTITDTQNSVIGGYVYRGSKMPGMVGRYIWADWTERKIKTLVYKGETGGQPEVCDQHDTGVTVENKVRSFGEGIDGEIYVVAGGPPTPGLFGSAGVTQPGILYRIDPM